eukprot:gene4760-34510_t
MQAARREQRQAHGTSRTYASDGSGHMENGAVQAGTVRPRGTCSGTSSDGQATWNMQRYKLRRSGHMEHAAVQAATVRPHGTCSGTAGTPSGAGHMNMHARVQAAKVRPHGTCSGTSRDSQATWNMQRYKQGQSGHMEHAAVQAARSGHMEHAAVYKWDNVQATNEHASVHAANGQARGTCSGTSRDSQAYMEACSGTAIDGQRPHGTCTRYRQGRSGGAHGNAPLHAATVRPHGTCRRNNSDGPGHLEHAAFKSATVGHMEKNMQQYKSRDSQGHMGHGSGQAHKVPEATWNMQRYKQGQSGHMEHAAYKAGRRPMEHAAVKLQRSGPMEHAKRYKQRQSRPTMELHGTSSNGQATWNMQRYKLLRSGHMEHAAVTSIDSRATWKTCRRYQAVDVSRPHGTRTVQSSDGQATWNMQRYKLRRSGTWNMQRYKQGQSGHMEHAAVQAATVRPHGTCSGTSSDGQATWNMQRYKQRRSGHMEHAAVQAGMTRPHMEHSAVQARTVRPMEHASALQAGTSGHVNCSGQAGTVRPTGTCAVQH